ncbi:MAG: elongation factor G [Candidatus Paceibacterota bacterium]|jgi:elongation factor G|nr:elongation factor G [Candidatus Paceibacterota bacterium]MDD3548540.1 elongation factor G [Candidatus Paceibacterota bacterium]MDD4999083.1 elongation factor G [Candidatus Paceibacterota bacterium]MDD5545216.1 elongation factor G [Candidatus Paceibacterota bacterium]
MNKIYPIEKIRNIGFIAHIDAGKTTTTERVLFYTGVSHKIGKIDNGDTVMDFMDQEKERGITIASAATTCFWAPLTRGKDPAYECQINIIDTPGHIDFTAEVQRSLRVLDGAVVIFDGVAGVESQSETVWHQADKFGVPRICFINKMDRLGASFEKSFQSILERLTADAQPINIPIGLEDRFNGVIDLIKMKAVYFEGERGEQVEIRDIPEELLAKAKEWRKKLIEKIVEQDDELLTQYLDNKEPGEEQILSILRKATIERKIIPVLCGSSFKDKGVQPLLDAIIEFLPSPVDLPPIKGFNPKTGEETIRKPDDKDFFSALVFKIVNDPYVGTLNFFRVYSGVFKKGNYIYNSAKNKQERVGRLLRMHAKQREEIDEIRAGDIAATVALKETGTGDTLCDADHPIVLESIVFPEPVISMKIEPETKADQEKMSLVLKKLSDEDPTFKVKNDEETSETLISGMGELHLEVLVERMRREFSVNVKTGRPQVAYKETIKKKVESEGKYIRQSGGRGQYGHVVLDLEPLERGKGFEFVDAIKGGTIPQEYIPAVEKGVKQAMEKGIIAGYPLSDVRITLKDGSYHEVDSSDFAFKIAGSMALQDGARRANPILLEPIMKIEVVVPESFLGDIIGDLSSKRGRVEKMEDRGMAKVIYAKVPLAEMFGYATKLRSMTEGRGNFTMEFDHYEEVPANVAQEIIGKKDS